MIKNKPEYKAWDKACFDCAVKRGWAEDIKRLNIRVPTPFQCVHRQDLKGQQHVCAGAKKALEEYKSFPTIKTLIR